MAVVTTYLTLKPRWNYECISNKNALWASLGHGLCRNLLIPDTDGANITTPALG